MGFFQKLFSPPPREEPQILSGFWVKDASAKIERSVPNINLTHPSALPPFEEIDRKGHMDPRALLYPIKSKTAGVPFTADSFSHFEISDFVSSAAMVDALLSRGLITELPVIGVLQELYTVKELKSFLQKRGLKVGGRKEELAARLLANGFRGYTRRYRQKLYVLTEAGSGLIQEECTNREYSITSAISRLCIQDYSGAVSAYNAYDQKWGYVHVSGKKHTIFSDYDFSHSRFVFLSGYPMPELLNSAEFKGKLRACLIAGLMRGEQNRDVLADDFLRICSEPVLCPDVVELYKRDREDRVDEEALRYMLERMEQYAESSPRHVLEYYISRVLHLSRR